jgi:16S rRNA (cytidine1402-2'-O)-methyltransferase
MSEPGAPGSLYIVSTPIGNMGDMSYRAVEVLSSAALVVAEDTRHSRRLLDHYGITTRTAPYHEHNEAREAPRIVKRLTSGESVALITDAGTPLLSDPGARLVTAAIGAGVTVIPVPGASALLAALVGSGLAGDQFTFFGFLPRRGKERLAKLAEIMTLQHTAILYEAPPRVGATLKELADAGAGARSAVVARELTKKFEEFARGTVAALAQKFADVPARGEVVILIGAVVPQMLSEEKLRDAAARLREDGLSSREIVERLTSELGAGRNLAYRIAHEE